MASPGLSTLGMRLGWQSGTPQSIPAEVTWLTRINSTSEITIDPATIDASALEDYEDKTIAGRAATGGTYTVTVNETDETQNEWAAVFAASAAGQGVWLVEYVPGLSKCNYIFVQTPQKYPKAAKEQNSLLTVEISCTIVDYHGYDTLITPPNA